MSLRFRTVDNPLGKWRHCRQVYFPHLPHQCLEHKLRNRGPRQKRHSLAVAIKPTQHRLTGSAPCGWPSRPLIPRGAHVTNRKNRAHNLHRYQRVRSRCWMPIQPCNRSQSAGTAPQAEGNVEQGIEPLRKLLSNPGRRSRRRRIVARQTRQAPERMGTPPHERHVRRARRDGRGNGFPAQSAGSLIARTARGPSGLRTGEKSGHVVGTRRRCGRGDGSAQRLAAVVRLVRPVGGLTAGKLEGEKATTRFRAHTTSPRRVVRCSAPGRRRLLGKHGITRRYAAAFLTLHTTTPWLSPAMRRGADHVRLRCLSDGSRRRSGRDDSLGIASLAAAADSDAAAADSASVEADIKRRGRARLRAPSRRGCGCRACRCRCRGCVRRHQPRLTGPPWPGRRRHDHDHWPRHGSRTRPEASGQAAVPGLGRARGHRPPRAVARQGGPSSQWKLARAARRLAQARPGTPSGPEHTLRSPANSECFSSSSSSSSSPSAVLSVGLPSARRASPLWAPCWPIRARCGPPAAR